jgi:CMP/dCMP kinase
MAAPESPRPASHSAGAKPGAGSITINGDIGSGKSTVAAELARMLGIRVISVGSLYRELALASGMTTLELNRHARRDEQVDDYIDNLQRGMLSDGERAIVDSRLGWHFLPGAFKVHLLAAPEVAAGRVMQRRSPEEAYSSLAETLGRLRERSDNERARFLSKYGVDNEALGNYDLVCDTSHVSARHVAETVAAAAAAAAAATASGGSTLHLPG